MSKKSAKVRGRSPSKAPAKAGEAARKPDPLPVADSPAAAKSPAPAPVPAAAPTQADIGRLAHDLWQQRGRPQGQDIDIWCEAERRLTQKS